MRQADLAQGEQSVKTQETAHQVRKRRTSQTPQYDLNKVRMVSPIDGVVTKRNIEEGETASSAR